MWMHESDYRQPTVLCDVDLKSTASYTGSVESFSASDKTENQNLGLDINRQPSALNE